MFRAIMNTSGCYYAFGYWLSTVTITTVYQKKRNTGWKKILIDIAFLFILMTEMYCTKGVENVSFFITMTVVVVFLFLHTLLICDADMMDLGTMTIRAFMLGETSASFAWMVFYRSFEDEFSYPFLSWKFLQWGIQILVVYFAFSLVQYMVEKKNSDRDMLRVPTKLSNVMILLGMVLLIYFLSNMSYVNEKGLFSTTIPKDIFIIHTLTDLVGVMFIYAYDLQRHEVSRVFELNTLQAEMEMQNKYYHLSKESMDMVNQKYHDLKHQIVLLKEQTAEDKQEYLQQMEKEIQIYEAQNKTGNRVLDVVLTSKSVICQADGIQMKAIAAGEELSMLNDLDVSALFGNMLDNAIEAELRVKDKEKRMIRVLVEPRKSFLFIQVSNYCEEKVNFVGGIPQTRKTDHRIHGFGIKSIQNIVSKYHGSVNVEVKDNWFQVRILIPKR